MTGLALWIRRKRVSRWRRRAREERAKPNGSRLLADWYDAEAKSLESGKGNYFDKAYW